MQRIILIIIGWLAVVLGYAGRGITGITDDAVILLAAWCFARSSPRFHAWLLYRSWFGGCLRFWQKHHAMPRGVKPRAILLILLTFAISLWFVQMPWVGIMLLVIRLFAFLYVAISGDS
ncbi:YbaN family protein [Shigella flexneri]